MITFARCIALLLVLAAQNTPPVELGTIQGVVTRTGSTEPISNAEIILEGGVVDQQALQSILRTASNVGIAITPPPGASLSEINQMLIRGAAERGVPLPPAMIQNVVNQAVGGRKWPTTTTDRDGRFVFKDVQPGRYTVRAARDGYFGKAAAGNYEPSAAVDVTVRGKDSPEAPISMVQGAIISGRVFDSAGNVAANVNVQAFSVGYANGYAQLQASVSKTTDERGEFRLLWAPPGDYYVGTAPRAGALAGLSATVMTFYPGVTGLTDAMPVVIRGGEDLRGIDIGMRSARGFKISGKVATSVPAPASVTLPTGQAALPTVVLMLVSRGLDVPDNLGVRTLGSVPLVSGVASFDVSGIPSGSYELFARLTDPTGTGAAGFAWGHVPIDIRDGDISDIVVNVASGVEVKGTVRVVGNAKLPAVLRIVLLAADSASKIPYYRLISTRGTPVDAEGSFVVSAMPPGRYRIGAVSGLPPDLYLADIRQNAASVFDSGFDVDSGALAPLEILIGSGAGVVEGTVQANPLKALPGATVVLVPESSRLENRALYATATTDTSGRFTFRGVAPGDHRLLALESSPPNAYQNLGFIRKHERRGKSVHVTQGSTVSAELTVTP
jgi:hypothetical protein